MNLNQAWNTSPDTQLHKEPISINWGYVVAYRSKIVPINYYRLEELRIILKTEKIVLSKIESRVSHSVEV